MKSEVAFSAPAEEGQKNQSSRGLFRVMAAAIFLAAVFLAEWLIDVIKTGQVYHIKLFFRNPTDAYMDFFNVNNFVANGRNPYGSDFRSSYPPLCLLIARFFALFGDYKQGSVAVRDSVTGKVGYFCFAAVSVVAVAVLFALLLKKKGVLARYCVAFGALTALTTPMLYLFQRGNYLYLVCIFLLWFALWYEDESRAKRECALVFLAVAAAIKLYPALFAVLLLKKRRFADFFKTAAYSFLLFILPFFAFPGGLKNFGLFLENLTSFQSGGQAGFDNYSMATFFYRIGAYFKTPGAEASKAVLTLGRIASFAILILNAVAVFFTEDEWKRLLLLGAAVVLFPAPSYVYVGCVCLPAFAAFLCGGVKTKRDYVYAALFLIFFSSVQLGYSVSPEVTEYGITRANFLQQTALIALSGSLVAEAISRFVRSRKEKKTVQEER